MGSDQDKAAKKARKAELKVEADKLGISYDELKKQKKERKNSAKKREADLLLKEDGSHETELKRMRTWSKDFEEKETKKRRTRSMDKGEELPQMSPEAWRNEHSIKVQGHGANANIEGITDPYFKFTDTPYCPAILKSFQQAGYDIPTHIQSQVCAR